MNDIKLQKKEHLTNLVFFARTIEQEDKAIDIIFLEFDKFLCSGDFDVIDDCLKELDVVPIQRILLISLLTITAAAKSKLPSRSEFYTKVEQEIINRGEMKDGLLEGLE